MPPLQGALTEAMWNKPKPTEPQKPDGASNVNLTEGARPIKQPKRG